MPKTLFNYVTVVVKKASLTASVSFARWDTASVSGCTWPKYSMLSRKNKKHFFSIILTFPSSMSVRTCLRWSICDSLSLGNIISSCRHTKLVLHHVVQWLYSTGGVHGHSRCTTALAPYFFQRQASEGRLQKLRIRSTSEPLQGLNQLVVSLSSVSLG